MATTRAMGVRALNREKRNRPKRGEGHTGRGHDPRLDPVRQVAGRGREQHLHHGLDQQDHPGRLGIEAPGHLEVKGKDVAHGKGGAVVDKGGQVGKGKGRTGFKQVDVQQGKGSRCFLADKQENACQAQEEKQPGEGSQGERGPCFPRGGCRPPW
nr:hypothetical protein [Moorella sulfitireducens]